MRRIYLLCVILSIFVLSVNAQEQSFKFISSSSIFKLDEQCEALGDISISPKVSTASESGISTILPNIKYNIEAGQEYTIIAEFSILDCSNNSLSSLNVLGLTNLSELWCYENNLSTLNLSGLTNLEELWLSDNQISSIDVSGLSKLKTLDCNRNKLKSLNLTDLLELKEVICFGNLFSVCGIDSVFLSLPEKQTSSNSKIIIADINQTNDIISTCRTSIAKEKKWKVLGFKDDYVSYHEIINSEPYGCVTTAMPEALLLKPQICIYPNPINDVLYIESDSIINELSILDFSGKLIFKENVNDTNTVVKFVELSSGMYILRIQTSGELENFKIVKE